MLSKLIFKTSFVFIFILCGIITSQAQHKWANFTTDGYGHMLQFQGDTAWVAMRSGLAAVDLNTDQLILYTAANSNLPDNYMKGFNINQNGVLYLTSGETAGTFEQGTFYPFPDSLQDKVRRFSDNTGRVIDSKGNLITTGRYEDNVGASSFIMQISDKGESSILLKRDNLDLLEIDDNDNLWFTDSYNSIGFLENGNITAFDSTNSTLTGNGILDIHYVQDRLYVLERMVDNNQIYMDIVHTFKDGSWSLLDTIGSGHEPLNYSLSLIGEEGSLWISYRYGEVYEYNGVEWINHHMPTTLPKAIIPLIQLLHVEEEGDWWVFNYQYNSNRIYKIEQSNSETRFSPLPIANGDFVTNGVMDIFIDEDNDVWLTGINGVSKYDGFEWVNYAQFTNLRRHFLLSSRKDKLGKLWVAMDNDIPPYNHLFSYDGSVWDTIKLILPPGTDEDIHINAVAFDENNTLWGATSDGLLRYDGVDAILFDSSNSDIEQRYLWDIVQGNNGVIYFYSSRIIYRLEDEVISKIDLSFGPSTNIFEVFQDSSDRLWVSHSLGLSVYDGNITINIQADLDAINVTSVSSVREDGKGNIWMGSDNGLIKFDGSNYTLLKEGLPSKRITEIEIDQFDNIWIGSSSSGLGVYNENGIDNIGTIKNACAKGTVYLDLNGNGEKDLGEGPVANIPVKLWPDELEQYTPALGGFRFDVDKFTDHHISLDLDDELWNITSDSTSYSISVEEECVEDLDFGLDYLSDDTDLRLDIAAGFPRCFQPSSVWITLANRGYSDLEGRLEVSLDENMTYLGTDLLPDEVNGNLLSWDFDNIKPFETLSFRITIQYPGVEAIGETVIFGSRFLDGFLEPLATDSISQEIVCSYDPNDKIAQSTGESVSNSFLPVDDLEYMIRFENSGTDTAFKVVLLDTLSEFLDIGSFEFMSSSHPVEVSTEGRLFRFDFKDIILPHTMVDSINSHGYVKYSISPLPNLPDGTQIDNTAAIYFDFNPPIITNTTENILVYELPSSVFDPQSSRSNCEVSVYPNPIASERNLTLNMDLSDGLFKLYDIRGREVYTTGVQNSQISLADISLHQGIYFYTILDEEDNKCHGKLSILR